MIIFTVSHVDDYLIVYFIVMCSDNATCAMWDYFVNPDGQTVICLF